MNIRTHFVTGAGAVLLATMLSTPAPAQTAGSTERVTIVHVKPDMLEEYLELEKNLVPVLKKGGLTHQTVYATSLFGNGYEYVVVTPIEHLSQFDGQNPVAKALGQPATARLSEQMRKCIESSNSFASTLLPEISYTPDGPPAPMIVTVRYHIAAGKLEDYINLMKSDVLPVYKKANVGVTVRRRTLGANPNDVVMSTAYTKYADLEGGPLLTKVLGADAANRINAKFNGIRTTVEVVVRRRVQDLTF